MFDWTRFLAPLVFKDEEKTRVAGSLNTILWIFLALAILLTCVSLVVYPELAALTIMGNGITAVLLVGMLVLMHRGHVQLSSALLVALLWGLATVNTFSTGGVRSPITMGNLLILFVATSLLGGRASFVVASLSILALSGMLYAEVNGFLPPFILPNDATGTWFGLIFGITIAAVLLHMGDRGVKNALERARRNERALLESNRELKAKVTERVRVEETLRQRNQELALLGQITTITATAADMADALYRVCAELARFLRVSQAGFAILNSLRTAAQVIADYHPPDSPSALGTVIPVADNPSMAYILEHKAPLAITDAQADPLLRPVHEIMRQRNVKSILLAPILVGGEVIGTLGFDAFQRRTFSDSEIDLVWQVASQTGQILVRKQAEEALRFTQFAVDRTSDAVFWVRPDARITYANDAACRNLGYSREELSAMTVHDIDPDFPAEVWPDHWREIKERGSLAVESRYRAQDGRVFPVEITVNHLEFEGEEYNCVFARDITERKRAEETLRENELRYRALFERTNDAVFIVSLEGILLVVNQQTADMLGYTVDELVGMSFKQIIAPREYSNAQSTLAALQAGQSLPIYERIYRRKDGVEAPAEISAALVYDPTGKPLHIQSIVRDITQRKQAEEALHRYAERLKVLHEMDQVILAAQSPEAIAQAALRHIWRLVPCQRGSVVTFDFETREGTVLAAQFSGESKMGVRMRVPLTAFGDAGELGQGKIRVVEDILAVSQPLPTAQTLYAEGVRSYINVPLIVQGELIGSLNLAANDPDGFTPEHIEIAREVSSPLAIALEQARLHKQMRIHSANLEQHVAERTAELAAVNKELEAFAYSVSHDLRAPLRSIDGFNQALMEDYADKLDAVGQDYLRRVRAASQRMGQLIDDLLKLSRLTQREMHRETVDLSALAAEIAVELEQREPERRVEFVIAQGVTAHGDAHLLRVALENLLGNACKFTSKQASARIEFGYTGIDGEPAFFVRDDGAGFDMAYASKLFGAFQRLHAAAEFEGTGIGLATVQRIIHRHGGRVWAEAEVGKGATFYFTLAERGEEMK